MDIEDPINVLLYAYIVIFFITNVLIVWRNTFSNRKGYKANEKYDLDPSKLVFPTPG